MNLSHSNSRKHATTIKVAVILILAFMSLFIMSNYEAQAADGGLVVYLTSPSGEPLNAYNLVVDSNATNATSTAAPNVATVAVRFCNESAGTLTNVWGNIGDGTTPGTYPARPYTDFDAAFSDGQGSYSFKHLGSASDGSRFIGTLDPGQCSVQYWHFTYPQCENDPSTLAPDDHYSAPCNAYGAQSPTWGDSVDPADDMSLQFVAWGTAAEDDDGLGDSQAVWTMHMRNEISAMANKIQPNPDGDWFNTDTSTVYPGQTITTNGVLYEFGNINQGFDNDGDMVSDYNAWAQPIGAPSYDPSCFQLVKTETELTVSRSAMPDLILNYTDQLYFTDLPTNNTGVRGNVYYTFLALDGACFSGLSPYQEVASGSDNEKFNADYGTSIPPLQSYESEVHIDKSSFPTTVPAGSTTQYTIPFRNDGDASAGLFLSTGNILNLPLLIEDIVPDGMEYICGTATAATPDLTGDPTNDVTIYYSQNGGTDWTTNETDIPECNDGDINTNPTSTAGSFRIQWWLNAPLPANATANNYARFSARIPVDYSDTPFIENCATAHFGSNGPAFDEACSTVMVPGSNSIGDFVWQDLNNDGIQDGGNETGINGVRVTLYHDVNGNGVLDPDETTPVASMDTSDMGFSGSGGDYLFTQLPDAQYIVVVDGNDPDVPTGYYPSPLSAPITQHAVNLIDPGNINYLDADFGFAPSVNLSKVLTSANPSFEGSPVRYDILVTNNRAGNGEPPGSCVYRIWGDTAATSTQTGSAWLDPTNAQGAPNGLFATGAYAGNGEWLTLTNFAGVNFTDAIDRVEVIFPIAVSPVLAGDLDVELLDALNGDAVLGITTLDASALIDGLVQVEVDISASGKVWAPADFAPGSLTTKIRLTTKKAGNPSGDLFVDAVGYRVTTSATCGNPSDTINNMPLTDTYDETKLQFVSANPQPTSVSGGTITWDNVGPVYAGQTKNIIVRFIALEPSDTDVPADGEPDPTTHTNCADTANGTFADGALVNSANDCVTHDINPGGTIGDLVWFNMDGDDVLDPGEYGLSGIIVNLCTDVSCTNIVDTTSTDASGNYLFVGVDTGTYYVQVDTSSLPDSVNVTWTNNYEDDCPALPCTGDNTSGAINLDLNDGDGTNDDYLDADFGYVSAEPMLIGSVWHDRNNSATTTPDLGEEGLAGLTVALQVQNCNLPPSTNNPCVTTTTDANGDFVFTNLETSRSYEVYVYTADGPIALGTWTQTFDTDGTGNTNATDNNGSVVNGGANLSPNTLYRVDFSYRNTDLLTIGDTIFTDWNGDSLHDVGEEGIPGVSVRLYRDMNGDGRADLGDVLIDTQVTTGTGFYQFTDVPGGTDYVVAVEQSTLPAGYVQTLDPGELGVCIVCDSSNGLPLLTVSNPDQDFAYRPTGTGSIGDYVWKDVNGDGFYNPAGRDGIPGNSDDETPIAGITVNLSVDTDNDGVPDAIIASTETDANGNYLFPGLPTDNINYIVEVDTSDTDLPVGFSFPSTPTAVAVTLTNTEPVYLDADFGFTGPARIGDYVWEDANGDGEQDPTENGIGGVTVDLLSIDEFDDADGNGRWDWGETILTTSPAGTTTTDAAGAYLFDNLPPGNYTVVVSPSNFGVGQPLENMTNTGDPDAIACNVGCDNQSSLFIGAGQADMSRDFGYRAEVSISGTLFFDAGNDGGIFNPPSDSPYGGVGIYLYDATGTTLLATTTTDNNGFYEFFVPDGGAGTDYVIRYDTTNPDLQGLTRTAEPDETPGVCGTCDGQTTVTVTGTIPVTDQDFGFFASLDCGDLPEPAVSDFNTTKGRNGACHVTGSLYLGSVIDAETDGQPETLAGLNSGGDDGNGVDDEDGVNRDMNLLWTPGANVAINVEVTGNNGVLVGWLDWNADGRFDSSEMVQFGAVSPGLNSLPLTVPDSYVIGTDFMVRFRLYDGVQTTLSPTGQVTNGEVEDYYWQFNPTAVTLSSFGADSPSSTLFVVALITLLFFAIGSVASVWFSRKQNGR